MPPAALLLCTLIFFNRLAFTDMILARGDTFAYFYPYWDVRNAALSTGDIPLWTPNLFMGAPLLANPQIGTLYLPNWFVMGYSAPDAVRISILLHIAWALLGAYLLARRGLQFGEEAAVLAAVTFGLGGYIGAHVEQINQLQGLSWMPWLFLLLMLARRRPMRCGLLLAIGLALQFLSGHTQTVFITVVGLGVYAIIVGTKHASPLRNVDRAGAQHAVPLRTLSLAGLLAIFLTLPQLVPTLELIQQSNRSGGLDSQQAVAFSFSPLIAARGLLPSYNGLIFGEFVAYIGIIALGLAVIGIAAYRTSPQRRSLSAFLIIGIIALLFAFGRFNPVYVALTGLPGFNFFRVPARWLSLFALSAALFAGWGLQSLLNHPRRPSRTIFVVIIALVAVLIGLSFLASQQAEDIIGNATPEAITLIGWGAALVTLLTILWLKRPRLLLPAVIIELFFASLVLAYNDLTPPEIYESQRLTVSQLRVFADADTPPPRMLSISNLLFDPGDKATLETRWRSRGLDDLAMRHAFVGTKMQETLAANLPLAWDVATIDGFGGGLLPTQHYADFTALLLPPGVAPTRDGRLRELLALEMCGGACIPEQRWLNLTGTRYLITDKVFDLWHEDVAYDTQIERRLAAGERDSIRFVPHFEADSLDVLYSADDDVALTIILTSVDGERETLTLNDTSESIALGGFLLTRLPFEGRHIPVSIEFEADTPISIRAMTLVDEQADVFTQLTLGAWRRILSSDIKLYENLDVLPRAFVVHDVVSYDDASVIAAMQTPEFDPAQSVVIADADDATPTETAAPFTNVIVNTYTDERIALTVESQVPGYLVLTDAYYPGWRATVNDMPVPIHRADVMFRAVEIPSGESEVVFIFSPWWWPGVFIIGGLAWLFVVATLFWHLSRK
ncbi:MAG: hypothetical protein D6737_07180 [Chloroflexi bacterium]|nr:MAG: hypothetical protein D6737_07180 [Chloroflexota bacterium]